MCLGSKRDTGSPRGSERIPGVEGRLSDARICAASRMQTSGRVAVRALDCEVLNASDENGT